MQIHQQTRRAVLTELFRNSPVKRGLSLKAGTNLKNLFGKPLVGLETKTPEDCDYVVIGGGSGGISCANRLGELQGKVVLFDYVSPSQRNSTWGFGGTCVNVGCIPKKLMHEAAIMRSNVMHDAKAFGLGSFVEERKGSHDWNALVETVQNYVKSLNFSYASGLRDNVSLIRAKASIDAPSQGSKVLRVKYFDEQSGQEMTQVARKGIIIAVGGRPMLPTEEECPGASEYGITSDDIFSLQSPPGKTLCVGGGYVSTEIASFLGGLGYDTTLSVRSMLLRGDGFDRQCADKIAQIMEAEGVHMAMKTRPRSIRPSASGNGYDVTLEHIDEENTIEHRFDTILFGTGRSPYLDGLGLEAAGVMLKHGKILVDGNFETTHEGIYALGDAAYTGAPELTPVAVRQGEMLANILCETSRHRSQTLLVTTDTMAPFRSLMVPSTVFAAGEYGRVGLSEDAAKRVFGAENIETYLMEWQTLTSSATHRITGCGKDFPNRCFAKMICLRTEQERVVGLHFVGPNAGEILQGFAFAVNIGVTKDDFDLSSIGIHPTDAEAIVGMTVTAASGDDYVQSGGCGGGRCG